MAFYDKFPYTNFQELNLDWLTQEVSKVRDNRDASDASAAAALASEKAAKASETAAKASETAAANSETAAATSAEGIESARLQIQTNTNRIDNLIVNGTPTEGNSELLDIRVGGNGVTYPTAGDAVRGQYTSLNSRVNHPATLLTQLNTPYYFSVYDGEEITIHSADGTNMTPTTLRLCGAGGISLGTFSLSGYSTPSRTVKVNITEPAVYLKMEGGTAQNIIVENNTRLLGHDFYTQAHQQEFYNAEKSINIDTLQKPYSFYGKPDDVCQIETVSGDNFTPKALEVYYGDGTKSTETLHDYLTNHRRFTVGHDHAETPMIGVKIAGGPAQELRLYNLGTLADTVLNNNFAYSMRIRADENEKLIAFRLSPGELAYIKTADDSNFTINKIAVYDKNGKIIDNFSLKSWNTNARSLDYSKSSEVYYIALLDGTPQDVILEYGAWKGSILSHAAEILKTEMPPASLFNSSDVLYHIDPIEKATEFSDLAGSGTDTESFIYFTDPHTYPHNDDMLSAVYLQTLIQKYYHSTPTDFVMCGGDWLQDSDTRAEAKYKLGLIQASMKSMCDPYYPVLGNHDNNYQGVDDSGSPNTGILDNGVITNLWFRKYGRNYYTFSGTNTVFYVFDSGSDWEPAMNEYRWKQLAWFSNALTSETHSHIAVSIHIWWNNSNKTEMANQISAVIEAYNNRQSISINESSYNYENATGRVEFVLSGHEHKDYNEALSSGVPVIATINAGYGNNAFDMVYADYDSKTLHCIRVGTGNNRTFSLTTGELQ